MRHGTTSDSATTAIGTKQTKPETKDLETKIKPDESDISIKEILREIRIENLERKNNNEPT